MKHLVALYEVDRETGTIKAVSVCGLKGQRLPGGGPLMTSKGLKFEVSLLSTTCAHCANRRQAPQIKGEEAA